MSISISGTVYADEGITTMGSGKTLNCSVNGAASSGSTTTASDGTYSLTNITAASGAVLTVYLQGNTEVGVAVTKSTGANMTGISLFQDHLVVRSDNGVAFTGTNMNASDGNGASGITAIYSAPTNTALTLVSGKSVYIVTGATQGYNMIGSTITGNVKNTGTSLVGGGGVNIGDFINTGSLTQSSSTWSLQGNFTNSGTLTITAGTTVNLTGTGSQTLTTGGQSFQNLTINGSGGTYTLQDGLSVAGNLTLTAGTLDVSASNYGVTVTGNWARTAGSFTSRNGTVTFNKTTSSQTVNGAGGSFYNLTHSGAGALSLSTSDLTVTNNLNNSAGTLTVSASNFNITVGGNWSNGGTFTSGTGTVTLNGTAQTVSGSTTFYNLIANTSGDVITFTDGTTQTISNSATFQNVTLRGSSTGGWTVAMPATQTIDHVTVSYSTATGNTAVAGATSTDGGSNVNWTFGTVNTGNVGLVGPGLVGDGTLVSTGGLVG